MKVTTGACLRLRMRKSHRNMRDKSKDTICLEAGGVRRCNVRDGSHRRPTPLNVGMVMLLLSCLLPFCPACNNATLLGETSSTPQPQARPARIISLSPSVTEIIYGVGAFARVIAVSDYCAYPPEASQLPRVGGWQNTNLERIASLRPDFVIVTEAEAPFIKDRLDGLKIPTLVVPSRKIEDAFTAIYEIGRVTGNVREAEQLAAETHAKLEAVRALTKDLPKRRVLCIVDRVPGMLRDLYTATEGSFIAQLIEVAGGESVAPPAENGYGKISKEAIVDLDPEIIIDMVQGAEGTFAEDPQAVWKELPNVRAVREGRVYSLREMSLIHPSQFVGDSARRFAEIIHPGAFPQASHGPRAHSTEATAPNGNISTPEPRQ